MIPVRAGQGQSGYFITRSTTNVDEWDVIAGDPPRAAFSSPPDALRPFERFSAGCECPSGQYTTRRNHPCVTHPSLMPCVMNSLIRHTKLCGSTWCRDLEALQGPSRSSVPWQT